MNSLAIISMVQPDFGFVIHTCWCGAARSAIASAMKCTADSTKIRFSGCSTASRASWYESAISPP